MLALAVRECKLMRQRAKGRGPGIPARRDRASGSVLALAALAGAVEGGGEGAAEDLEGERTQVGVELAVLDPPLDLVGEVGGVAVVGVLAEVDEALEQLLTPLPPGGR